MLMPSEPACRTQPHQGRDSRPPCDHHQHIDQHGTPGQCMPITMGARAVMTARRVRDARSTVAPAHGFLFLIAACAASAGALRDAGSMAAQAGPAQSRKNPVKKTVLKQLLCGHGLPLILYIKPLYKQTASIASTCDCTCWRRCTATTKLSPQHYAHKATPTKPPP